LQAETLRKGGGVVLLFEAEAEVEVEDECDGRVLELWRCLALGTCVRCVWLCTLGLGSWLLHLFSGRGDVGDVRSNMVISGGMEEMRKTILNR
jgi:hypothetical protein